MHADKYRELAANQAQASNAMLEGLDLTTVDAKLLLALVGRMNVAVYQATADVLDAIAQIDVPKADLTPDEARANRMQRLRRASMSGDQAQINSIMKEIESELTARATNGRSDSGSGGQADADS